MKQICLLIVLFAGFLFGICNAQQSAYTEIRGNLKTGQAGEIKLYLVENGDNQVIASTKTGPEGSYGFFFVPPYDGFYTLEIGQAVFPLYLKAGDKADIDILPKGLAALKGVNTKENEALFHWLDAAEEVRTIALGLGQGGILTYKEFFPAFEKLLGEKESIKNAIKTGNSSTDEYLKRKIDFDTDLWFLSLLYSPRVAHPEKTDRIAYYDVLLSGDKFATDEILKFPDGMRMLTMYLLNKRIEKNIPFSVPVSADLESISNPVVKGEYLLFSMAGRIKSYDQYLVFMEDYGSFFVSEDQKSRAEAFGSKIYQTASGTPAADFSYPDAKGKTYSLSDFKGKVVVVDVWATWCGPCRQQFPFLKKLEEEMRDKNVVFLGITIDAEKDREKWIKMIETEGLPGIHLFAGSKDKKITADYKINAIPRYLVFDKKGNVVSADAPRPEDPELKKMLERELAK